MSKTKKRNILLTSAAIAITFLILTINGIVLGKEPELKYYSGNEIMTLQEYSKFQQILEQDSILNFELDTTKVQIGELYSEPVYKEDVLKVRYKVFLKEQAKFAYGRPIYKSPAEYDDIFGITIAQSIAIALCFGIGMLIDNEIYEEEKGKRNE